MLCLGKLLRGADVVPRGSRNGPRVDGEVSHSELFGSDSENGNIVSLCNLFIL